MWRVEEVTESEKLYGHGLDGQNFLDIFIAMIEIYKALTTFRIFWEGMERIIEVIEDNEEEEEYSSSFEWETDDELDD